MQGAPLGMARSLKSSLSHGQSPLLGVVPSDEATDVNKDTSRDPRLPAQLVVSQTSPLLRQREPALEAAGGHRHGLHSPLRASLVLHPHMHTPCGTSPWHHAQQQARPEQGLASHCGHCSWATCAMLSLGRNELYSNRYTWLDCGRTWYRTYFGSLSTGICISFSSCAKCCFHCTTHRNAADGKALEEGNTASKRSLWDKHERAGAGSQEKDGKGFPHMI